MKKICIIVIGVTHHNTMGLVRCLGMAGINVNHLILTDGLKSSYIAYSKYVKNTHFCSDDKTLLDIILSCHDKDDKLYFVIPCTDSAASLLDNNYDLLSSRFVFFNAGCTGKITQFMNKKTQVDCAYKVGLKVPYSYEHKEHEQIPIFPCLIKYKQSISGGKHLEVCKNQQELTLALKKFGNANSILIQEFIQKKFEIVILGLSVNGDVYIPGYIMKHRDFDGGTNYSSVYPVNDSMNDLLEKCKLFVKNTSYEGLFGIEFINNGKDYYFIEINLRNDATTYALAVAGANLPQLYIQSKAGHSHPDHKLFKIRPINAIVEFNDFKHRKEYGVSIRKWIIEFLGSNCKYYFNWKDPKPFFIAPFK